MSKENAQLIQSLYDAFAAGDVPTVLAAFDPQILWNEAENFPYADGNPYVGPDAVVSGIFARLGTDFDSFEVRVGEILDAGDTVVMSGRYVAKHKSGRALDAQVVHVWKVKGGKVVQFQQYTDTYQAQQVFGSA